MSLELKKRIGTSFFLIILLILMFNYSFLLVILTIIIALISWVEFYALISKIFKKNNLKEKIKRSLAKVFSLIYLSTIVFILITNYELKDYIFFTLLISIFSDIGGLSVGSLLFSLMLIPFFISHLTLFSPIMIICYTFLISITTQVGDLFISLLKRKAKVENTSDLLPGHGGFLDRIDGIIFAIPMGMLLLNFI